LPKPKRKTQKPRTKAELSAAVQKANAKRQITNATKRLKAAEKSEAILAGEVGVLDQQVIDDLTPTVQEEIENFNVVFRPNPGPQSDFLAAEEREVLYGGAAGGGKSYAMIMDCLRDAHNPNHRAILFRRTNDQLREIILNSRQIYPLAFPGAKWNAEQKTWTFPSGATIWFTYLDNSDDVLRYQGQAFNWIGFDELTNWPTQYPWDYMRSRLRTSDPTLKLYMRATTNPGGPGASWVRKMFIEPSEWNKAFPATDIETGEVLVHRRGDRAGEPLFYRRFIPAKLSDNPTLFENGEYEAGLLSLPEAMRRQLLEGDWDVCEGAAFTEFYRPVHVVEPFDIPGNWRKFRAADWGYEAPAVCLWFAIDYDQNLWVYRELMTRKTTAEEFAALILDLENGENIQYGVLDGSAFNFTGGGGPSPGEVMQKAGCRWRKADRSKGSRAHGKLEVHRRLRVIADEYGEPTARVKIFSSCKNLIRTLPVLPIDPNNSEDIDTDAEDHCYDAFRYGLMSRPMVGETPFDSRDLGKRNTFTSSDSTFGY
jgi:hypothetical protein